jgi:hypothetical protein
MTHPLPAIPAEIRDALEKVLAYAMPDEADHFANTPPEERDGHIYQSFVVVSRWLNTGKSLPADLWILSQMWPTVSIWNIRVF